MDKIKLFNEPGFRGDLLRSHLLVTSISLILLLMVLISDFSKSKLIEDIAKIRSPRLTTSLVLKSSLQNSFSALQGWINTKEEIFKEERKNIWLKEINPSLKELEALSQDKNEAQELIKLFAELEMDQWWIEDIANTPGNNPAKLVLEKNISPIAESIIELSENLSRTINTKEDHGDRELTLNSINFISKFKLIEKELELYISNLSKENNLLESLEELEKIKISLSKQSEKLTRTEEITLSQIIEEFEAFKFYLRELIEIKKENYDIAKNLLESHTLRLSERINNMLSDLVAYDSRLLINDSRFVNRIGAGLLIFLFALFPVLIIFIYILSSRQSQKISEPLIKLLTATQKITQEGLKPEDLKQEIPILSKDILGELSESFNIMRRALYANIKKLNLTAENLQKSENLNKAILEASDYSIISGNPDGLITSFNKAAEKMLGYKAEEMIGINTPGIFHDIDEVIEYSKKLSKELGKDIEPGFETFVAKAKYLDKADQQEWTYIKKDGTRFPVLLSVSALKDTTGEIYGYLGVAADISSIKENEKLLEDRTRELERSNSDLEQFAYIASHDLQEPLRTITNYIDILDKKHLKDKVGKEAQQYINYIKDGVKRMKTLINDILAFSKVGKSQELVKVDMRSIIESVLNNLDAAIKDSGAEVSCPDNLPEIIANEGEIYQLTQNLISNAIKFKAKDRAPLIKLVFNEEEDHWKFSIEDNGIGMKSENYNKIFDVFQRLHTREEYSGNGIGLAITKRIIEKHGGNIWVESELDKGTTFHFTISKKLVI